MNGEDGLGLKDVTFLRAIRDINGSPERYASTERGVTPATVTAITKATTLSETEVAARFDHPGLGNGDLVRVYEADRADTVDSAELTEAGEQAIAEAENGERAVAAQEWQPNQAESEFDDMQEWEPADVENDGTATESVSARDRTASPHTHSAATRTAAEQPSPARTRAGGRRNADSDPTTNEKHDDRLAALEARIEELEAESDNSATEDEGGDDESADDLAEEVAALRETTDRLASTLEDAVEDLEAIRESEYGALDEKRERQFETAVKSMVAFHQLATEVLDVRVENYEPSAGRADPERVEITRNRIGDALGVGQSGDGGGGTTLDAAGDDSDWPDPEEAARGGRVFGDDGDELDDTTATESTGTMADDPAEASDAPDSGVYPPIGGDEADESGDENDGNLQSPHAESDAPDSGVYPPIGGSDDEGSTADAADDLESTTTADGSLPESIRPDTDATEGAITETAAEAGHVGDPIRRADADEESAESPPLETDAADALAVRDAIVEARSDAGSATAEFDDPYPDGEAFARVVGETDDPDDSDLAAGQSDPDDPVAVQVADGQGPERTTSGEDS